MDLSQYVYNVDLSKVSDVWPAVLIRPTGSRYICNPPVMDTDDDYIVLVKDMFAFDEFAQKMEYELCGDVYDYDSNFATYRKGDINLIVTEEVQFFSDFWAATLIAKSLNLTDRNERKKLFRAVLYGETE